MNLFEWLIIGALFLCVVGIWSLVLYVKDNVEELETIRKHLYYIQFLANDSATVDFKNVELKDTASLHPSVPMQQTTSEMTIRAMAGRLDIHSSDIEELKQDFEILKQHVMKHEEKLNEIYIEE